VVDDAGNVYITGMAQSSNFPTTAGAYDETYSADNDVVVLKLNPIGTDLIYSTYIGDSGSDVGSGIEIDDQGNAYIVGHTGSSNFPTTTGAYDETYNGLNDFFALKLDATGTNLEYSTFVGGTDREGDPQIAIDENNNIYFTGMIWSSDFPTTPNGFAQSKGGGTTDAVICQINSTGSDLVYSSYIGGSENDRSIEIAIDINDNVFISGYTSSSDFPTTPNAYNTGSSGDKDAFVIKLNSATGDFVYSSLIGGDSIEEGYGLVVDDNHHVYVAGQTNSTDFPTTGGAYDTGHNGDFDLFAFKLGVPNVSSMPPATPQNLAATAGDGELTLTWDPNTEVDLHKYVIYRDTAANPTTVIDSVVAASPPDTFYVDTNVSNGSTYYYRITAVDNAGNASGYSNEVSETPV
ncbi:MAG: hypothetical protein GY869_07740, partial [Planctomycetes bacterium]|nr:hypothetical protein [Planctomycetota bacterium]